MVRKEGCSHSFSYLCTTLCYACICCDRSLVLIVLNQAASRKLKPHPQRPVSLHERLLEGIKSERKLRPVSPDMIRRNRLGKAQKQSINTDPHTADILRSSSLFLFLSHIPTHSRHVQTFRSLSLSLALSQTFLL